MKQILLNYVKSLGLTFGGFLVAASIAWCLQGYLTEKSVKILRLVSGSAGTVALFGRLGWSGQTWGGSSPPEKLDRGLYKSIYALGYILFVLSLLL